MKTIKVKAYEYRELNEEAKQKALNWASEAFSDYNWYMENDYMENDNYNETAKKYGVEIRMSEACFDLDRGSYLAFETFDHSYSKTKPYTKGIYIDNPKKFCRKAGVKYNPEGYIGIEHDHYSGGEIKNRIACDGYSEGGEEFLQACLDEMLHKILDQLRKEYEYQQSREFLEGGIEANEYLFTKEGNRRAIL